MYVVLFSGFVLLIKMNNTTRANQLTEVTARAPVFKSGYKRDPEENLVLHQILNIYLQPIIIIVGLVGNVIILLVMRNKNFSLMPLRVYISALAVTDSVVLFVGSIRQFLRHSIDIEMYEVPVLCTFTDFFLTAGVSISGWLVVCLGVERALVVLFPHKAKRLTSVTKAKVAVCVVTCAMVTLSSPAFWMTDYSSLTCEYRKEFVVYSRKVKGWIVLIVYSVLPLVLLAICYTILVIMVMRARKKRKELGTSETPTDRLTVTAIYICLSFMIFTAPLGIYVVFSRQYGFTRAAPEGAHVARSVIMFWRQLNYSTNLFIYLGTNHLFRRVARQELLPRSAQVLPQSSNSNDIGM